MTSCVVARNEQPPVFGRPVVEFPAIERLLLAAL